MIRNKKELKDWLHYEKSKYKNVHVLWLVFPVSEQDYIWRFQWLLRHREYHMNCYHKIRAALYKALFNRTSIKLSIHIPENTCGRGLKIMHTGPILINGKATIGDDVSLHINTSIVAHGYNGGVPHIGDKVVLGVGSVVLGDTYVADGIAIGANAVVNKSFDEPDIAIAGVPAKKISNNGRIKWAGKGVSN